jgi:nitrate/nitrite transport system permease protein
MTVSARPLTATNAPPKPSAAILPLRPSVAKSRVPSAVLHYASQIAARVLPPLVTLAVIIGIWQILCSHPGATLPAPSKIVSSSWELIAHPFYDRGNMDKGLFWHLLSSLKRVGIGFSLAAVVGIGLGVLIGQSVIAHRGLDPIFQVLRTVPPLAWLPLSLAAFRNADPSAIFVIFITAVWPIVINTAVGVQNIPQDYRNVARVLRLNGFEYFWRIMLPASVPYIFTGLKIGVGLSWLAIVAAEMLIGGVGIGFFIWDAWNSSLISDIIVALIYVGLVGYMLDRLIALLGYFVSRGTVAK